MLVRSLGSVTYRELLPWSKINWLIPNSKMQKLKEIKLATWLEDNLRMLISYDWNSPSKKQCCVIYMYLFDLIYIELQKWELQAALSYEIVPCWKSRCWRHNLVLIFSCLSISKLCILYTYLTPPPHQKKKILKRNDGKLSRSLEIWMHFWSFDFLVWNIYPTFD